MSEQPHIYGEPDNPLPGVTGILSVLVEPGLVKWRERVGQEEADRVAKKAQKIGTAVHRRVLAYLAGKKPAKLAKDSPAGLAWRTWLEWYATESGTFRPSRLEQPMASAALGYGGTPDAVEDGAAGGLCRVTDWKFGSRISEAYWVQLHGYAMLAWPSLASPCPAPFAVMPRLRIVRIDPFLGMVEAPERDFDPAVAAKWLDLVGIYHAWYWQPWLASRGQAIEEGVCEEVS